jgi:asparagine synthase (glutamine-hydrolysing)
LPAGGLLQWGSEPGPDPAISEYPWSFDSPADPELNIGDFAEDLAAKFRRACRQRVEAVQGHPLFLSLSGGLDSRAVAAGLADAGSVVNTRTFALADRPHPVEERCAQAIAEVCGLPWKLLPVSAPTAEAVDRLVYLKDGLNNAGTAYAEEYLNSILANNGESGVFFTGEGGDIAVVERHPGRAIRSTRELANLILERLAVFDPAIVASVTGIVEGDLRERLAGILEACPEQGISEKHLHFSMMTTQFGEYFEGEDRNRAWLWPCAPFYARPFFDMAMTAPTRWKRRRCLQTEFLKALNCRVAVIPNANTGRVPGSLTDRLRQFGRETVLAHPVLEKAVQRVRKQRPDHLPNLPETLGSRLVSLAEQSPLIDGGFSREHLGQAAREATFSQSWLLYTVLRYFDMLNSKVG